MRRVVHVLLVLGLCAPACCGQGTTIKVLPWDNHPAAISLTFDDARPVQLDVAVPELNKRHLHATFFVIVSKLTRLDDWRKVQHAGHEIGNHSLTHPHPDGLSKGDEELQIEDAKRFLDSNFQSDILTFAYPYAEISAGFSYWVKRYNFAARGWRGDNNLLYVAADNDPDWYNLPSQPTNTQYDFDVYKSWVDHALSINAWTTLQIHGIGDVSTGYEPIPTATFISLLNYLRVEQDKGLWVAPFGEVAAYLRAQRVIEKSQPQLANQDETIRWDLPQPFPKGVVLKVTLRGQDRCRLFQGGHELRRGKDGTYPLSFDAKELVIRGRA
ncbi:MAG: polysaccharide deacetylase family protein [Acidobacteria bacterium]|nr:polysaccharide deacetylase family protein [Acidobacteriota bacterium]MBV9481599.1 polysaccharide deacetylase family protein [Acidobacteriota bacterium]